MGKLFLDVGGYRGESSRAALDPRFGFDLVYCFEPVHSCSEQIRKTLSNNRLRIVQAGLLDKTLTLPVHGAGTLGASVYADARQEIPNVRSVNCAFIRASEFFRDHIRADDRVWMKLNCEGAEVAILNDLLDSGEATKLREVLITFDAAKIPSMRAHVERLEARLATIPFDFHYPQEVQYGMVNNFGGIRNWLLVSGASEPSPVNRVPSLLYQIPYLLNPEYNGYYKIRFLRWLGLRPPPDQISSELRNTWSHIDFP